MKEGAPRITNGGKSKRASASASYENTHLPDAKRRNKMIIVTTDGINGKELEMLGMVKGSTIQTVNAFRDIGAGLKTLVGGELKKYNEMMDKARQVATDRMLEEAQRLGADAIVGARYATSAIMQSAAEVMAYGTAVKFK